MNSYKDVETPLINSMERLIDFVTVPAEGAAPSRAAASVEPVRRLRRVTEHQARRARRAGGARTADAPVRRRRAARSASTVSAVSPGSSDQQMQPGRDARDPGLRQVRAQPGEQGVPAARCRVRTVRRCRS